MILIQTRSHLTTEERGKMVFLSLSRRKPKPYPSCKKLVVHFRLTSIEKVKSKVSHSAYVKQHPTAESFQQDKMQ
jgi:hypothetical protein